MNSKDGIDFAKLFTLKTTRKAGGLQILRSHGKVSRAPRNFRIDEKVWHIDYEKQPVELKVDVKGPFVGIGWEF